jgi:hypothetical protein
MTFLCPTRDLHADLLDTVMIVIKIYRNSASVPSGRRQLMPLVWIIIESAAVYTYVSELSTAFNADLI